MRSVSTPTSIASTIKKAFKHLIFLCISLSHVVYLGIAQIALDPNPSVLQALWGTNHPGIQTWCFYLQNELHRNQQRYHSQQHACTLFKISKAKSGRYRNVQRSSEKGMQGNPKASRKKKDILRSCSQKCPLLTSF